MNTKKIIRYALILFGIPLVIMAGVVLFHDRQYAWISLVLVILSCIPFFMSFERRENTTKELVLLAALVAISVVGRFVFSPIPHFKPVSAMVIITGMYFGSESGFLCGALSAIVSNFIFGQGPWTPFQMFAWGMLGLIAGLLSKSLLKNRIIFLVYGSFAGGIYSCIMDIWTTLQMDGTFNWRRYLAALISALPTTTIYIVSNVMFLLLLEKPIGKMLDRIKTKYGLTG